MYSDEVEETERTKKDKRKVDGFTVATAKLTPVYCRPPMQLLEKGRRRKLGEDDSLRKPSVVLHATSRSRV